MLHGAGLNAPLYLGLHGSSEFRAMRLIARVINRFKCFDILKLWLSVQSRRQKAVHSGFLLFRHFRVLALRWGILKHYSGFQIFLVKRRGSNRLNGLRGLDAGPITPEILMIVI